MNLIAGKTQRPLDWSVECVYLSAEKAAFLLLVMLFYWTKNGLAAWIVSAMVLLSTYLALDYKAALFTAMGCSG